MLAARITCHRCGNELTVTESAPPEVTCPRCLAALVNPASPLSGVRPVPVIPLEQQVAADTRWGTRIAYAVLALLGFAAAIAYAGGNARLTMLTAVLVGGMATLLYSLGEVTAAKGGLPGLAPSPTPVASGPPGEAVGSPPPLVLHYNPPRSDPSAGQSTASTAAAVILGFFTALAVCAFGFYILAATADTSGGRGGGGKNNNAAYLMLVLVLLVMYIVATVAVSRRWRGFAPGAIAGLCLGMMALGPCAACYLLTLG